jgi:hypothetical protein
MVRRDDRDDVDELDTPVVVAGAQQHGLGPAAPAMRTGEYAAGFAVGRTCLSPPSESGVCSAPASCVKSGFRDVVSALVYRDPPKSYVPGRAPQSLSGETTRPRTPANPVGSADGAG